MFYLEVSIYDVLEGFCQFLFLFVVVEGDLFGLFHQYEILQEGYSFLHLILL